MTRRQLTVPDRLPPYYSLAIAAFVITLDYEATFTHGVCDACLKEQLGTWKRSG